MVIWRRRIWRRSFVWLLGGGEQRVPLNLLVGKSAIGGLL
jgi:hypothetical protein